LSQEKYKETREADENRKQERNKNFSWLEEQIGTMNQHVKKGGGLLKGGGSSIARKPKGFGKRDKR